MHTQIRFGVAEHVIDPHTHVQITRDTDVHTLGVDYRFRDMHVALHGAIVGADKRGAYTLLDNIVLGAVRKNIQIDCVAPADWPTSIVAEHNTNYFRGPDQINDATARYRQEVQRRNGTEPLLIVIVDHAALVFYDDARRDDWRKIALLGATRNVSVLALADDLTDSPLLPHLGRGNLFHLRTPNRTAGDAARAYLPDAHVEDLPAPDACSYGYAYVPHGHPIQFAVQIKRR